MSIFEITMLLCFGSAWPFSIYRSWHSRRNEGKSIAFLSIVLVGYAAGILHKILYSFDAVFYLYVLNTLMVLADMLIFLRNKRLSLRS